MKKTMLGLLLLLVSASTGLCQDLELPFEISSSQSGILVRGKANGKPVLLILDTGASRTILARGFVALPRPVPPSRFSTDGPGFNARGTYTEATLELGGRVWRGRSVVGMEMEEVSRAFGQRIDGLLGQDLLREFDRVTIDFRAGRIVLSSSLRSSPDRESPSSQGMDAK